MVLRAVSAGTAYSNALNTIQRPTVGGFDTATFRKYYPFSIWKEASGSIGTDFDWRKVAPNLALTAANAITYWVATDGNDSNTGLSRGQAFASINKAITSGNTAAVPYIVNIMSGTYRMGQSWQGPSGTAIPTQHCAFFGIGGPVISTCSYGGSYVLDQGTTYVWSAAGTLIQRVFDIANLTDDGDYTEYLAAASLAACRATPGTYFKSGSALYVTRSDGAAVTISNTRAIINSIAGAKCTTSGNMYVEGIDFEGGEGGTVMCQGNTSGRIVFNRCSAKYDSSANNGGEVWFVRDVDAVYWVNCVSACGQADGFSVHATGGKAGFTAALSCTSRHMGIYTKKPSSNCHTTHDGARSISINCSFFDAHGWTVAPVLGAQHWSIGDSVHSSVGDLDSSPTPGTAYPANWGTDQNTPANTGAWVDSCVSRQGTGPSATGSNPYYAFYTDDIVAAGAFIYYRNCDITGTAIGPNCVPY